VSRTPKVLLLGAVVAVIAIAGCGSKKSSNTTAATTPAPAATTPAASAPAATTPAPAATTPSSSSAGETVTLAAVPGKLAFDKKALSAKAGTVTLKMSNPSSFMHGVSVEGNGVDKDGTVVGNGGTSTVTVKLKPGKYTFYCPVPGHRAAGMQGTLTVS
jgi:plastocyanin